MADTDPQAGADAPAGPGVQAGADAPARSPLHGRARELAAIGAAEVAFLAQVDLRADPALAPRLPFALPLDPNTWTAGGGSEALWLGPDQWLVVGAPGSAPAIAAELGRALRGEHHSVVDTSANRTVVELAGDGRLDLLAQGCAIDLHRRAWRPGRCAQTLLARVPVLLQERQGATRVFVRASFAAHLAGWLHATGAS